MTLKKSNYIHLAIMFILAFGISYLPPFGQVTPFGMKAIGVLFLFYMGGYSLIYSGQAFMVL